MPVTYYIKHDYIQLNLLKGTEVDFRGAQNFIA